MQIDDILADARTCIADAARSMRETGDGWYWVAVRPDGSATWGRSDLAAPTDDAGDGDPGAFGPIVLWTCDGASGRLEVERHGSARRYARHALDEDRARTRISALLAHVRHRVLARMSLD